MSDGSVSIKGPLGSNSRSFNTDLMSVKAENGRLNIEPVSEPPLEKKAANAAIAVRKQIENDMAGVKAFFEIKMQSVYAHFPLTMEAGEGFLVIKNMLGERAPRRARLFGSTKVEVKGQALRLYGTSKDDVTQSARSIRQACRVRRKDDRTFQDGIYYALE